MRAVLRVTVVLVAVMLVGQVVTPVSAAAAPACSSQSSSSTGLGADAHPVVLVHGWRGKPMQSTREELEKRLPSGSGWQFLLFDYHSDADEWAASDAVAGCLANYLYAVSEAHRAAGGDGRVFVVAHSMGGLVLRFAVQRGADSDEDAPADAARRDLGSRIGGLVTLDTPHQGAPWGDTAYADLLDLAGEFGDLGPIPQANTLASRCLAAHTEGQGLPAGCAAPPYLPTQVPVHQVEGAATVGRSFFGFHAYDLIVGGDGIVPSTSSAGYLGSAPGETFGREVSIQTVPCRKELPSVLAQAGARAGRGGGVAGTVIGAELGTLAQLWVDGKALDSLAAGRADASVLGLLVVTYKFMPCGHEQIATMSEAMDSTAEALRTQAEARPVTEDRMRSLTLPREHGCSYADPNGAFDGATLVDGHLEGTSGGFVDIEGIVLTDLDGDGVDDGLAHLVCSSGAGGTSSMLLVRTATRQVGELPYGADADQELSDLSVSRVEQMTADRKTLVIDAYGHRPEDSTCCPSASVQITYDLGSGGPRFAGAEDLTPDPSGGVAATADGFGPVRLGMTAPEAFEATGDQFVGTAELGSCTGLVFEAGAGQATAYLPIDEGVVTSIETPEGTRTDRGVGSGYTIVELDEVYGDDHTTGVIETQAGSAAYVTTGNAEDAENGSAPGLIGFPVDGITLGPPTVGGIPGFEYCSG